MPVNDWCLLKLGGTMVASEDRPQPLVSAALSKDYPQPAVARRDCRQMPVVESVAGGGGEW